MLSTQRRAASFSDLKMPAENISPSSTLDILEQAPASPQIQIASVTRRLTAQSARHVLSIDQGGRVCAAGDSALEEEGECFIAHLGLGDEWGAPVDRERPAPIELPEGTAAIVEVAAGDLHSLLLSSSGSVWSFGGGWEGPLGHGDAGSCAVPRPVLALAAVRIEHIAAGGAHSLAVSDEGQVWSWGWGLYGQLGHGDTRSLCAPRRIEQAPTHVAQVAAGHAHTLLVCQRGRVYTCGRADSGQLGHGPEGQRLTPHVVNDRLAEARIVEAHAVADYSYARALSGERYAWGREFGRVPTVIKVAP